MIRVGVRRAFQVALVAVAAAALVAVNHAANVGGSEGFVYAGRAYTDGSLVTFEEAGYDGQFMYRMAVDPLNSDRWVAGVVFDEPAYRMQMVGYPATAWMMAKLTPLSTTQALVVLNIAALGVLVFFGARILEMYGRHPFWALGLLLWPSVIIALTRDTADLAGAALVLGGVWCVLSGKHWAAAVVFAAAALTRPTSLLFPLVAMLLTRRPQYVVPFAIFGAWQSVLWAQIGKLPVFAGRASDGSAANFAWPFQGLTAAAVWSHFEILVFAGICIVLIVGIWKLDLRTYPGIVFAGYAFLVVLYGTLLWDHWMNFARAATELWLAAFLSTAATVPLISRVRRKPVKQV